MERQQIVSRDPDVMNGALVFAGTRVPVEILVAGDPLDKFLNDFPTVSREQAVGYLELTLHEAEAEPQPVFGSGRGLIEIADDFDAPVEGFEPYAP